jgi:predicted metal-dependent peptidase
LSHHKRLAAICPCGLTEHQRFVWNVATDLVIQQMLARHCRQHEPEGIITIDGCIPHDPMGMKFLDIPGLKRDMKSEKYYQLLLNAIPEQDDYTMGDGKQVLDPSKAGSNSDGQQKDWEQPSTGVQRALVTANLSKVSEEIIKSGAPGNEAGAIAKAIDARVNKQPDPFDELRRIVGSETCGRGGTTIATYSRPNRRQQPGGTIRKGYITFSPSCSIIIDTSGSMSGYERKALTAISQGLRRIHRPRVVAYDYKVQQAQRLNCLSDFKFRGYGGTDMRGAIESEDKRGPDAIVLVTDGETDWPAVPPKAKLIIALVKRSQYSKPPHYARVIDCTKEVNQYDG